MTAQRILEVVASVARAMGWFRLEGAALARIADVRGLVAIQRADGSVFICRRPYPRRRKTER